MNTHEQLEITRPLVPTEMELPSLITELTNITTTTNSLICSIQECVAQSALCHNILSDITMTQFSTSLANDCEAIHHEVSYICDLFSTLQIKLAHLAQLVVLIPSFEHELDTIIALLPSLEKRVSFAVNGIKNETLHFLPPSRSQQEKWHSHINSTYTSHNVTVPTDSHNSYINDIQNQNQSIQFTPRTNPSQQTLPSLPINPSIAKKDHYDSPITVPVARLEDFISLRRSSSSSSSSLSVSLMNAPEQNLSHDSLPPTDALSSSIKE